MTSGCPQSQVLFLFSSLVIVFRMALLTMIMIIMTIKKSSGWGTTSSGGSTSNVLLEVDVKVKFQFSNHNLSTIPTPLRAVAKEGIHRTTTLVTTIITTTIINITTTLITAPPFSSQVISNSECNGAYGGITNNMLCAADASGNGGSDACQVDVLDHHDVDGSREGCGGLTVNLMIRLGVML